MRNYFRILATPLCVVFVFFFRFIVTASINMTMYGGAVVYILLAAENISELLPKTANFSFCYIAVIIACVLLPATWLGTPKDFW